MDRLYLFLIRNDIWIYIICGLGLFWYISEFIRARQLLRRASFGLERETGGRVQGNALLFILLLLSVVAGVVYVNTRIQPNLPAELLRPPTPTPDIFRTPLRSPTPLTDFLDDLNATPTSPLAPTVTLPGTNDVASTNPNAGVTTPGAPGNGGTTPVTDSEGTVVTQESATAAPATTAGCSPLVNISQPANGSTVFGSVAFLGTATGDGFAFYKLEINGPQTGNQWASLVGQVVSNQVINGLLGSANFNGWADGRYTIKLTIVDGTSNEIASCSIQINLDS
ncbi:MAG: hypothetical protein KDE04_17525 [Anaerolineales bacterium]|nr:hypothetical protein [Anaerolineales bacterium]